MTTINPERIHEIMKDCMYKQEELNSGNSNPIPEDAIIVEGLMAKYGFHPDRLSSYKKEIEEILDLLPISFQPVSKGGGGGHSFLNMCQDKNGELWGQHRDMEALCCLAIGLNLGYWGLKEFAAVMPGGMPYFCLKENNEVVTNG